MDTLEATSPVAPTRASAQAERHGTRGEAFRDDLRPCGTARGRSEPVRGRPSTADPLSPPRRSGGAGATRAAAAAAGASHGAPVPALGRAARRPHPGRDPRAHQGHRSLRPGARDRVQLLRRADHARRAQALLPRQRLGGPRPARDAGARDAGRQRRQGPFAAARPLALGRRGGGAHRAHAPSRCSRRWRPRRPTTRCRWSPTASATRATARPTRSRSASRTTASSSSSTARRSRPTLQALPARDRIVLHLRFVEDMTQAEIAERVGVSQMHVSRLIRRALERLRTVAEHSG